MIRMIYNDIDRYRDLQCNNKIKTYELRDFEYLTNWHYNEDDTTKPFRDEHSKKFLKEAYNLEFFSDDDWYSLIDLNSSERFSLSGLSGSMKYALVLLHNSRFGVCTEYEHCSERIWQALSKMPFDILVAINNTTFNNYTDYNLGVDYIIEHYPLNKRTIELNVLTKCITEDDAEKVTGTPIYKKNNEYFIECFALDNLFETRYFWKEHLDSIIKECNHLYEEEHPLLDKSKTWSLVDFAEKIKCGIDLYLNCDDKVYTSLSPKSDEDIVIKPLGEILVMHSKDSHELLISKYSWLVNDLKIITHLYTMPKETVFRKLPMLFVDKYPNGSYKIWGKLTVKYPEFHEILSNIIDDYYTEECERYVTIVDVEELFDKASDIERTVCGFKITKNCIDIYDKNDAIHLFATMTQEAFDSGKVEISKEFY